ncbi:MAG: hypothetical protein ABJ092_07685 [Gillisia sp.]
MQKRTYILVFLVLSSLLARAQETFEGTLANWTGDEAIIGYYDIFNSHLIPLGEIDTLGNFLLQLEQDPISRIMEKEAAAKDYPEEWKIKYHTLENYFGGEHSHLKITNDQTLIAVLPEFHLTGKDDNLDKGVLLSVSSPAVADFLITWEEAALQRGDYYLNWIFTNDEAEVSGYFTLSSLTGHEDEVVEITTTLDLKFHKGWNILKTEFTEIYVSENGNINPTKVLISHIETLPGDVKWLALRD